MFRSEVGIDVYANVYTVLAGVRHLLLVVVHVIPLLPSTHAHSHTFLVRLTLCIVGSCHSHHLIIIIPLSPSSLLLRWPSTASPVLSLWFLCTHILVGLLVHHGLSFTVRFAF
jgi:hypothetical protein